MNFNNTNCDRHDFHSPSPGACEIEFLCMLFAHRWLSYQSLLSRAFAFLPWPFTVNFCSLDPRYECHRRSRIFKASASWKYRMNFFYLFVGNFGTASSFWRAEGSSKQDLLYIYTLYMSMYIHMETIDWYNMYIDAHHVWYMYIWLHI